MNRVAITGAGVVSAIGTSLTGFRAALTAGRSGIARLSPDAAKGSGVEVVAAIDWDGSKWLTPQEAGILDRGSQFALAAAAQALAQSALDLDAADRDRCGVYWGAGMGGAHTLESSYDAAFSGARLRPLTVVTGMANAPAANLSLRHGLRGPFANFATACSSSAMAIGDAMRTIAAGRADAIVAGGSEALLTPVILAAWNALRTLAPADPQDPAASCKPFDERRLGLVLGEGAAAFGLESEAHANARGARIHGYIVGYGNTSDAMHISRPDAVGQARAIREALAEARIEPRDVGYINAHGTATAVGDVVETEAIKAVFGDSDVRVSSTKSMHGHLLGGAGALELNAALLALEEGVLPPTAFLDTPDPACALNHVAREAQRVTPPRAVMSNSFAFGGSNVVLVATRE